MSNPPSPIDNINGFLEELEQETRAITNLFTICETIEIYSPEDEKEVEHLSNLLEDCVLNLSGDQRTTYAYMIQEARNNLAEWAESLDDATLEEIDSYEEILTPGFGIIRKRRGEVVSVTFKRMCCAKDKCIICFEEVYTCSLFGCPQCHATKICERCFIRITKCPTCRALIR